VPTDERPAGGSPSLTRPDFWWYEARGRMLRRVLDPILDRYGATGAPVLDVGSADGPSNFWAGRDSRVVSVDPDPRGLAGNAVCARLPELPFPDHCFAVVSAFDVLEHCPDERAALNEIKRVLRPGGLLVLSVPAYQWAWTDFDLANGHYRRYTRARALRAVTGAGLHPVRATYAFAAVFPAFAAQRLVARAREARRTERSTTAADIVDLPPTPRSVGRVLSGMCRADEWWLSRRDLALGSSLFLAATAPGEDPPSQRLVALTSGSRPRPRRTRTPRGHW
jgi:SAM-dependent methyltransferase